MSNKSGKARIVVCEDEVLIAADLESRLKALGYDVCGKSSTGYSAIELVERHQPDLVMMDIVLQGETDGIDAAEVIRDKWGIPVVFLTAYADTDRLERAKLTNPFGYLLKPFHDRDLKITLEMALYVAKVDAKRRKAEDDLRQSQRLLDSIVENIPSTLFLKDAEELRFVRVNRATEELTGISREELYGKNDYDFVPKEQADFFTSKDRAVLKGKKVVEIKEEELQTRDKGVRILNTRKIPLFNNKGEPKYLLGISHDITERKQVENELRLTLDATTDGIWSWNFKTNELSFSPKYYTMLGYEPNEFLANYDNWVKLIHPDDLESALSVAEEYLKTKPDYYENEFRIRTKGGKYRWISAKAKVVERYTNGEAVRMIGNHQDITEHKQTVDALQKSKEKYRVLADNASDVIFTLDMDLKYTYVSPSVYKIRGYTPEEVMEAGIGQNLSSASAEKAIQVLTEELDIESQAGSDSERVRILELEMKCKDGSTIWSEVRVSFLRDDDGNPMGIIGASRDISDRKRGEEKLKESEAKFRSIFEKSPYPKAITEASSGRIIEVNEIFCQKTGLSKEDLLDKTTTEMEFYSPEERAMFVDQLLKQGKVDGLEMRFITPNQEYITRMYAGFITLGESKYVLTTFEDITESTRVENARRRQHEMLVRTEHIANVGSWEWEIASDTVVWSDELFSIFNLPPSNNAPSWAEHPILYHPEDFEKLQIAAEKAVSDGTPYELELRAIRKDGEIRFCIARGFAEKDSNGKVQRLFGSLQDITDRKKAEKQRQEGFDLLNNLARLVPGVIYQYRLYPDGRSCFPYSSPGIYDIYEVTPEEVLEDASVVFRRIHPEDHDRVAEAIFESARTLNTFYCELRVILPTKGFGWRWSQAHPERTEDGGTLWHGIILDTTESKMAEEALRERDEHLRAIMTHSPLLISEFDTEGRYKQVNPAVASLFQLEPSEIVGQRFHDLLPLETAELFIQRISRVVDTGRPFTTEDYLAESHQSFITTLFPLFDDKGDIRSIGSIAHDITDRKQAEVEKEKLQAQLQQAQKMEAVGTLAGGVAHDFNNLLQAINGFTQLLLMDKPEGDPEYPSLTAIQNSGKRAADLVRSLLLFSRKADTERKPLELNMEVEHARKILERTIPKMVDIDVHTGRRLWTIMADPVQVEQILLNLGSNAADAMPDGGKLTIETANITLDEDYAKRHAGAQPGRYVLLTISDTGHGMDRETQEKIFEPFFTTKEFGKGTGLGLASVYGIVKSHDGYIKCYSEVGQGTTFKIYLHAMEPSVDKHEEDIVPETLKGGDETILLVDDEQAIRGFAEQALMKFGYKVFTASNGEEALDLYQDKSKEIDLVITDIGMPGMGGHKFLQELLKLNPAAKVLIASGYSINGPVKQSMEAGAIYVGKPYQLSELLGSVREALDKEQTIIQPAST